VKLGFAGITALQGGAAAAAPPATPRSPHAILTPAEEFEDVSRGNPKPFTLTGDALAQARLTRDTWRLEITTDPAVHEGITQPPQVERQFTLADDSALTYAHLRDLTARHRVLFLKAMQCLNIPQPLGQGLWEGVPLRDVLRLCGRMTNVRRIFFWGFHNNDPKQLFQSSLSYSQVMETPPGELPAFLALKLNGEALSLKRGGPVRVIVPWAHGFKSIKWLQHIRLTNDYRANDTYAEKNNDPESPLKTAAYLDEVGAKFSAGAAITVTGLVISGWSGLRHVEYWLRPVPPDIAGDLAEDDPAWAGAQWQTAVLDTPPADWSDVLPRDINPREMLGFHSETGQPPSWPTRYGMAGWSATLRGLKPGHYEIRARAVDLNGFAQPEPRPIQKSGKNSLQMRRFEVV
jgi:DMSO/TMAO reductase YedYZ molybdopterin-dependent catalytic subunit